VLFFNQKTSTLDKIENNEAVKSHEREVSLQTHHKISFTGEKANEQVKNNIMTSEKRKTVAGFEDIVTKSHKAAAKQKPKETPEVPKSQGLMTNFFQKK